MGRVSRTRKKREEEEEPAGNSSKKDENEKFVSFSRGHEKIFKSSSQSMIDWQEFP